MNRIGHGTKLQRARILAKNIATTVTLITSFFIGTIIGYQYHSIKIKTELSTTKSIDILQKKEVNLALDEKNNIILINKKNGVCIIFEDSLGYSIFDAYAKRMLIK